MITTAQVIALAAWPPCPIHLPEQINLGGHTITDVPRNISLHVSRLDSPSKLLARLSRHHLDLLIEKLTQPYTI